MTKSHTPPTRSSRAMRREYIPISEYIKGSLGGDPERALVSVDREHEVRVVRCALAASLVPVAHDRHTAKVGHLGLGIAVFEVLAKLGPEVDLVPSPHPERTARFDDDRVLSD